MTHAVARWLDSRGAFRVVQAAAAAALLLSILIGVKQYTLASCLADYNDRSARATGARAEAAERDRAAQDRLWQAVDDSMNPQKVAPAQARDHVRAAFVQFLADRRAANEQRANNPPPAPPSQACR